MTDCAWVMRDGRRCYSVALVGEFCAGHARMRGALEREDEERVSRGEPSMNVRERDVFLRELQRVKKAAKIASYV